MDETLAISDCVDLNDFAPENGEAHHRGCPPVLHHDGTHSAVHEHWKQRRGPPCASERQARDPRYTTVLRYATALK
jgi:hypothetical protein